jgi:hypothetical protein
MKTMFNAVRSATYITDPVADPHLVFQKQDTIPNEKGARYSAVGKTKVRYTDREKAKAGHVRSATKKRKLTPNPPPHAKPKFIKRAKSKKKG